nr:hypothetical protein [Methylomarinum sp. Ch1-1]MDP4522684.1 hypothetical protein [Methylomarinum sp. Ch1-1]
MDKLKSHPDWNTVKTVELLMIPLLSECDLDIELRYQLHKAATLFNDQEYAFFNQEFKKIAEEDAESVREKTRLVEQTDRQPAQVL